jgi:putative membrane protein
VEYTDQEQTKFLVNSEGSATSVSVAGGSRARIKPLRTFRGTALDRGYIDNEVTYHQTVIDALDKALIPDAKNAELKALLIKVRPAFVLHLEHAKLIQELLQKTGG